MTERKLLKNSRKKTFLKGLFAVLLVVFGFFGALTTPNTAFADPVNNETTTQQTEKKAEEAKKAEEEEKKKAEEEKKKAEEEKKSEEEKKKDNEENCYSALGEIGWLVCPGTGKIASAVDWLYKKIESVLQINPVKMEDGAPIYEIWKYCRAVTNIIFVIFLLVVIYSQITGVGISNYGLKKALPKLIIAAILVNLSFLICSLAVDVSNIIGNSLRGVFTAVEQSAISSMSISAEMKYKAVEVQQALAGGTTLLLGAGMIGFETGAIWMLIPVVLGAIVAVVTGLVTIALRQAVVMILIMVSPLAMVAYILPNTEQLFEKWKKLLTRMLVFYPLFSLLFGASSLAGFAIITGAKDGFGVLLGVAVQIFPLFFSWSLMKMSGTILGTINEKLRSIASKPVAASQNWANSRKELSRQKHLNSANVYTPSRYLMRYMENRKIARETETAELAAATKERGAVYAASLKYYRDKNGKVDWNKLSKEGIKAYNLQARRMGYAQLMAKDANNFNQGFDAAKQQEKLRGEVETLNVKNMNAADNLFVEKVRGEKIDYDNARGRYDRFEEAMNAEQDRKFRAGEIKFESEKERSEYTEHFDLATGDGRAKYKTSLDRYNRLTGIMDGVDDIHYFGAAAAAGYSTQIKLVSEKYQKYFEMLPPTKDVTYRLQTLTLHNESSKLIDAVIPGLRVLNARGDTDLVRKQIQNLMADDKLILGTHASQAVASFLMSEVKDSDPTLRRLGKYINLETAALYTAGKRSKKSVDLKEFVLGGYEDLESGEVYRSKKGMETLLDGTSFDNVERTAFENYDSIIRSAFGIPEGDELKEREGHIGDPENYRKYLEYKKKIDKSITPAFISASLKYLSGSEQLVNAVKFVTGYSKKDGVWETEWSKYENNSDEQKSLKEYYMRSTYDYLNGQTSTQILGLRSDYKEPIWNQLADIYAIDNPDSVSDAGLKDILKKRSSWDDDKNNERTELLERYQKAVDANDKKAQESIRTEMASAQLRNMLDENGRLDQIYESRRSGAANNAKDWLRKMVGLGDQEMIMKKLRKNNQKKTDNNKKRPITPQQQAAPGDTSDGGGVSRKSDLLKNKLDDVLRESNINKDRSSRQEYLDGLMDFADNNVHDPGFFIEFETFCKDYAPTSSNETLYSKFCELLKEYVDD